MQNMTLTEKIADQARATRHQRVTETAEQTTVTSDLAAMIGANFVLNLRGSDVNALLAVIRGEADASDKATVRNLTADLAYAKHHGDLNMVDYYTRNI